MFCGCYWTKSSLSVINGRKKKCELVRTIVLSLSTEIVSGDISGKFNVYQTTELKDETTTFLIVMLPVSQTRFSFFIFELNTSS